MAAHRPGSSGEHWWDINLPLWLGLPVCLGLLAALAGLPLWCSKAGHPWAAVGFAAAALPAWGYLGPRPSPGFLSGLLCVQGLLLLLGLFVVAAVHAVRGSPGAG
jgi:hypothetical protein